MEVKSENVLVMIPLGDLEELKRSQREILEFIAQAKAQNTGGPRYAGYILAQEFMKECGIKRWKFDRLIAENKIRTIKKKRKIYVLISEVQRYFTDPDIQ